MNTFTDTQMNFQLHAKTENASDFAAQQELSTGIRMNEACFPMNPCPRPLNHSPFNSRPSLRYP